MDLSGVLLVVGALLFFGVTIYLANVEDANGRQGGVLRWLLYGAAALTILTGLAILQLALQGPPMSATLNLPPISLPAALAFFAVALVAGGYSILVTAVPATRLLLRRILGAQASFDPMSNVHMTAIVLGLTLLVLNFSQLIVGGGLSGLAETIQAIGISVGELLFQGILWVIFALLGVGLAIRRSPRQTVERLGLRWPTRQDVTMGVLAGVVLVIVQIVAELIWVAVTSPEQLREQTVAAQQIQQAINTLPLALVVSLTAAVGEEIFFRGALQPVFGIVLTSLFFAVVHIQYTLTPATVVIFVFALGIGWLRQRYSTTAAIIAHFVYNFVPLTLAVLAGARLGGP